MIQQQTLEKAIDSINANKQTSLKTFKHLKIIIKSLNEYTSNPDTLPPETLIPCALFNVPQKLSELIGLKSDQILHDKPEKLSHDLLIQLLLKSLLKLAQNSSQEINHVVVEGMNRCVRFLGPYERIAKKWMKVIIGLWSTSVENLNIPLRCHIGLSKYLSICESGMYMWILRRLYVGYFENCKQVSWKNYEHINFMINSFCEFLKINPERAYYVLFGYLRSISLLLDKLNKSKKKQKVQMIQKLFSNQILNCFKLFSMIVCRVEDQEMTALVYPLCQLISAYERITESPEYIPLKLHILSHELKIMQALHIYIPHTFELIKKLLNTSIFNKKLTKKSQKVYANIQIGYKLSKSQLGQAHLVNELFKSLITKVYMFGSIVSKNIGGAEVMGQLQKFLKKKQFAFSGYKEMQREGIKIFKEDTQLLAKTRRNMKMSVNDNAGVKKYENKVNKKNLSTILKYEELREEEEQILKTKLAAEEEEHQEPSEQDESQVEDEDQVNSGWQQASQGASEYDFNEQEQQPEEGEEEVVSYEGDPQDVDGAVEMWQEQEWDSQDDIQN